jgi:hypothetical protein
VPVDECWRCSRPLPLAILHLVNQPGQAEAEEEYILHKGNPKESGPTFTTPASCIVIQLSGSFDSSCNARAVDRCTLMSSDLRYLTRGATACSLPNDSRLSPQLQQRAMASAKCRLSRSSV